MASRPIHDWLMVYACEKKDKAGTGAKIWANAREAELKKLGITTCGAELRARHAHTS